MQIIQPTIAVSLGDPAGIGPEIVTKALNIECLRNRAKWLLIGEHWLIDSFPQAFKLAHCDAFQRITTALEESDVVLFNCENLRRSESNIGRMSAECGRAGLHYVHIGTKACLAGIANAIVTAPLNKEAVAQSGERFCGHTEYIAELCGVPESRMMLWNERLAVVHVSTHISLREATELSRDHIVTTIRLADLAYRQLRDRSPRIAVCGLNPHAGESGLFGNQEKEFISPSIEEARCEGINCVGPLPADTLFLQAFRGTYDVVIAMYHDQGHIPMKLMDFDHTVNVTLGLPIIRTSVDHGTAFDIAGKNIANSEDMVCAMDLAIRMTERYSIVVK